MKKKNLSSTLSTKQKEKKEEDKSLHSPQFKY